jgi:molybdate transport system ATP-binding protein
VFQDSLLFPHMDVESNLRYGQRLRSPERSFIDEARIVDLLGLTALLQRKPRALSGASGSVSPSAARCSRSRASC